MSKYSMKLIQDCIEYDKNDTDTTKTVEEVEHELDVLSAKGCIVDHIMHCPGCPKFGKNCPI